jgi:hypothetical protein
MEDPAANALELDQPLLGDPLRNIRIQDELSRAKVADSDLQVAGGGIVVLRLREKLIRNSTRPDVLVAIPSTRSTSESLESDSALVLLEGLGPR